MLYFVGLGNYGVDYTFTRHNIGFMWIDFLKEKLSFPSFKKHCKGEFTKGKYNNLEIFLFKPLTYMNLSGDAVLQLRNFYKFDNSDIIVFHDDLALNFLDCRYKFDSGDGGQKGIRDINNKIGKNYHRIKFGIGSPSISEANFSHYVLGKFNKDQLVVIFQLFFTMFDKIDLLLARNFSGFVNLASHFSS